MLVIENFKIPYSDLGMESLSEVPRDQLEAAYMQRVIILYDLAIWLEDGNDADDFPFMSYGMTEEQAEDYRFPMGESADNAQLLKAIVWPEDAS